MSSEIKHLSHSGVKAWKDCPYQYKLLYLDKLKEFTGNAFTAFGRAVHETCELIISSSDELDCEQFFLNTYKKEVKDLKEEVKSSLEDKKLLVEMISQGKEIINEISSAIQNYFGDFEVVSIEEELYEKIPDTKLNLKGYIDLIIQTKKDGKYHIIDLKTCTWGWDKYKKSDKMVNYQLVWYKYFWAKKHNVDLKDIEIYFVLLKRTAKPTKKVEIFRSTAGKKRIEDSLNLLRTVATNIDRNNFPKNRTYCNKCQFYDKCNKNV